METWYEINTWSDRIKEVRVKSSTDKFIVNEHGRREAKQSSSGVICKTKEECKVWRIAYHEGLVEDVKRRLHNEQEKLEIAKSIHL